MPTGLGNLEPRPSSLPPALLLTPTPPTPGPLCTHPHSPEALTREGIPDPPPSRPPHPLTLFYISISHVSKSSVYMVVVSLSSRAGRDESLEYSPAVSSRTGDQITQGGGGGGGLSVHTSRGPGPPSLQGTTQGTTVSPSGPSPRSQGGDPQPGPGNSQITPGSWVFSASTP